MQSKEGKLGIGDSGCITTMVKSEDLLDKVYKDKRSVQLGDRTSIPIRKIGKINLSTSVGGKVKLEDSLLVPDLRKNLLSKAKLADAGVVPIFL